MELYTLLLEIDVMWAEMGEFRLYRLKQVHTFSELIDVIVQKFTDGSPVLCNGI